MKYMPVCLELKITLKDSEMHILYLHTILNDSDDDFIYIMSSTSYVM